MENWQVRKRFCFPVYHDSTRHSEFTQQDGLKKRTGKRLSDKHDRAITWVFCRDLHFTQMFLVFHEKSWLRKSEVWRKFISNKIIVTLVTQGLPLLSSLVLLRKFTSIVTGALQAEPLLPEWGGEKEAALKSPRPDLLDWSILFSLVKVVFRLRASVYWLNWWLQLSPLYQTYGY